MAFSSQLDPRKIEIPARGTYKLDRMREAVQREAHPELGRRTLLVAGTNGKGSTCAYLTHLFIALGWRVGTYTSPHVRRRGERIRINGIEITESRLRFYERRYSKTLEPLTYFERLTLIAFLYFRDQKVDLQILEVGVGGRLDATNLSQPDLSVITRIDYDHQEVLGDTLAAIAQEKAGIMRSDRPVIVGRQSQEALLSLKAEARRLRARWVRASGKALSPQIRSRIEKLSSERGEHQTENMHLAVACFLEAQKLWGFSCSTPQINRALQGALPLARIQVLRSKPLFMVDGSHNLNSVSALVFYLKKKHPRQTFRLVFGMMRDKPVADVLSLLRPWICELYLPHFYLERQWMPSEIKDQILKLSKFKNLKVHKIESLPMILKELWRRKDRVLVVGSLYLAGEALNILEKRPKKRT